MSPFVSDEAFLAAFEEKAAQEARGALPAPQASPAPAAAAPLTSTQSDRMRRSLEAVRTVRIVRKKR